MITRAEYRAIRRDIAEEIHRTVERDPKAFIQPGGAAALDLADRVLTRAEIGVRRYVAAEITDLVDDPGHGSAIRREALVDAAEIARGEL